MSTSSTIYGGRVRAEISDSMDFHLPDALHAGEPPEVRGIRRDEVRLMVTEPDGNIEHVLFRDAGRFLAPGDVLAVNTSATMKASLPVHLADGTGAELHLSTNLPAGLWTVELRRPESSGGTSPILDAVPGTEVSLPSGGSATLLSPYATTGRGVRLWVAKLDLPGDLDGFLDRHGSPIRYGYVAEEWPISYYQTAFSRTPGSAEMPSAGRPFTPEMVTGLVSAGVGIAPILLHTGVSSVEDDEPPYEEWYEVSAETARTVNHARKHGGRVVAVGTTVVRALESTSDMGGELTAGSGWTELVITPERGVRAVDGIITGLHEPRSSHLAMLQAISTRHDLEAAYGEAIRREYLWHEFGDSHMILRR